MKKKKHDKQPKFGKSLSLKKTLLRMLKTRKAKTKVK